MSPSIPMSRFREEDPLEPLSPPEPEAEPFDFQTDEEAVPVEGLQSQLRAQLEDSSSPPPGPVDAGGAAQVPSSNEDKALSAKPSLSVPYRGGGTTALPPLQPCPFCGEALVQNGDDNGGWYGHRNEAGECWASTAQIRDEVVARRWNKRSGESLPAPKGLKPKQLAFIDEFLKNGRNATKAYIAAGYNARGADANAARLMGNDRVCAEISRRTAECSLAANIMHAELLWLLTRALNADICGVFDEHGNILPPGKWPDDVAMRVTSYDPGSPRRGSKVSFNSGVDILFRLLDELTPAEERLARQRQRRGHSSARRAKRRTGNVTFTGRLPNRDQAKDSGERPGDMAALPKDTSPAE